MKRALHFVGFKDSGQLYRAALVFGTPHFVHRHLDQRMLAELMDGDTAVFACDHNFVCPHNYDDSERF